MSKIPPDLDQTIWQIAERGDQQAAAEFSERFPALAEDMKNRLSLVAGVKGMRKAVSSTVIPTFTPRYLFKPKPLWIRYGPSALGIAAIAAASFYITQNMLTPLPDTSILTRTPHPAVKPPAVQPLTIPTVHRPDNPDADTPKPYGRQNSNNSIDSIVPAGRTMELTNVHLQSAMLGFAKHSSLKLEIPPDFPNPMLDKIDLIGVTDLDYLRQLGVKYGFTVFDEGDGHFLVVNATDAPAPATN
jgi:hypothetical protein